MLYWICFLVVLPYDDAEEAESDYEDAKADVGAEQDSSIQPETIQKTSTGSTSDQSDTAHIGHAPKQVAPVPATPPKDVAHVPATAPKEVAHGPSATASTDGTKETLLWSFAD